MTRQTSLFDDPLPAHCTQVELPPQSRKSDPPSSRIAAEKHEDSGKAATNRVIVENYVHRWPGLTSKQLSEQDGCRLSRHEIARRLPEVERMGMIESRQGEGKGKELTWWPT